MTIRKSIAFFAPYIVSELNQKSSDIAGGNSLIYGGEITVQTSTTVDIAPYIFIQDGLTVSEDQDTLSVTVPDYSTFDGPVHILVSSPDAQTSSGVTLSVAEGNEDIDDNSIVIASRVQNVWTNPQRMSLLELKKASLLARGDVSAGRVLEAGLDFDDGYKGWGTNQAFHLKKGVLSDPAGVRKVLEVDTALGEGGSAVELDLTHLDPDFYRNDYIVLRRTSDSLNVPPEIVYAQGDTFRWGDAEYFNEPLTTPSRSVHSLAGNTRPSVSYNAAGEHVVVHGNGSNLYHSRLDHTNTRAIGLGPTATAAGAAVSDVFIAERKNIKSGDRLYGCCIVGAEVAIFRTAADGGAIGGGDIDVFTSMSSTPAKPHMVITGEGTTDKPLYAHIVFQHSEGSPNNQIYYTKYALADSTWGTAGAIAVQPRIARGFNGGLNHTAPTIAAHPDGELHIAYVHASGSGTVGEIRYLIINQSGGVEQAEMALASGASEVNDGTGSGVTLNANCEAPKVVISPQGTIYVVYMDRSKATLAGPAAIAWEETLSERTGFEAVVLFDFTSSANTINWHSAFSDDLGNLCWLGAIDWTGPALRWYWMKFQPTLVSDGVNIEPDSLNVQTGTGTLQYRAGGASITDDSGEAKLDRDSSLSIVNVTSNTVYHYRFSSTTYNKSFLDKRRPHPRDVYVGYSGIPLGTSDLVGTAAKVMTHQRRIQTLPPFKVVGADGDEGTFSGLQEAIWAVHKTGGKVFIRGGAYYIENPIDLVSGVELIGDGHTTLILDTVSSGAASITAQTAAIQTVTVADAGKRIFQVASGDLLRWVRPGDIGFIASSASYPLSKLNLGYPFTVQKVIDDTTFQTIEDLAPTITGYGANARAIFYSTGTKIRNLTIIDNRTSSSDPVIATERVYYGVFSDIYITSPWSPTIATLSAKMGFGSRFENIYIQTASGAPERCIDVDGDTEVYDIDTALSHCICYGDIRFGENQKYEGLRVDGCSAQNYIVGSSADEAPAWTNNAGEISATSFDSIASWSEDSSVFANRIIMNNDSSLITAGNVRGSLIPVDSSSLVGNTPSKHWFKVIAQGLVAEPSTVGYGLTIEPQSGAQKCYKLDASNLPVRTGRMAEIYDWNGDMIDAMEATGRWAGNTTFYDDFAYRKINWVTGGTPNTSNFPTWTYNFPSSSGADVYPGESVDVPAALRQNAGGYLVGEANDSHNFVLRGPPFLAGGWLAAGQRMMLRARYAIGGTGGLLWRTDRIGLIDTFAGTYKIRFEYTATGTSSQWDLIVYDGISTLTDSIPGITAAVDTWVDMYIIVTNTSVQAWASAGNGIASVTPIGPGVTALFAPFWEMDINASNPNTAYGYLDFWKIYINNVRV